MKRRPDRSPKVAPFPVLTIRRADDWEPALTLPIAQNTSSKTLRWVRMMVTAFRKYWQEIAASELLAEGMDDEWMNTQIRRASARLTEIEKRPVHRPRC
jgi:hypothetical protein